MNSNLNYLLNFIRKFTYIPLELLSKYYIRIYTCESRFTSDMRNDLMNDNKNYMPYIKTLYKGLENNSLKLASDKRLYSAGFLTNDEIIKIDYYLKNKKKNLPGAIVFSKLFLSFSKDLKEAERFFIIHKPKNVLITVDIDDNRQYSLLTHADIEEFSFFPNEKEVLFFPFSAFEIKNFSFNPQKQIYEMHLDYLGKYLKKFKDDKNLMLSQEVLPKSEFKTLFANSGLVEKEKINNIKINQISEEYHNYEIKKINKNKEFTKTTNQEETIMKMSLKDLENPPNTQPTNNIPPPPPPCSKTKIIISLIYSISKLEKGKNNTSFSFGKNDNFSISA